MLLHDPVFHKRNTSHPSSLVGRVAVAEAAAVAEVAAVAGAVRRGKSITSAPMSSALGGSRLWSTDSVSPSPAAVTVSRPLIPPASEPAAPRSLVPAGACPPTEEASISVL